MPQRLCFSIRLPRWLQQLQQTCLKASFKVSLIISAVWKKGWPGLLALLPEKGCPKHHVPKKHHSSEHFYWANSTAPAEIIWQTVNNLADLAAWHPLITGTNAPYGQDAKPGLIYRVFSRYLPVSTQIFVERVDPGELLSVRVFPLPGLQERATYRIVTTLCGTCVIYSVTLSGWLSPIVWPMVRPRVIQVATSLVQAAEDAVANVSADVSQVSGFRRRPPYLVSPKTDIFT